MLENPLRSLSKQVEHLGGIVLFMALDLCKSRLEACSCATLHPVYFKIARFTQFMYKKRKMLALIQPQCNRLSCRTPSDPNNPVYKIHGKVLKQDPNVGTITRTTSRPQNRPGSLDTGGAIEGEVLAQIEGLNKNSLNTQRPQKRYCANGVKNACRQRPSFTTGSWMGRLLNLLYTMVRAIATQHLWNRSTWFDLEVVDYF